MANKYLLREIFPFFYILMFFEKIFLKSFICGIIYAIYKRGKICMN